MVNQDEKLSEDFSSNPFKKEQQSHDCIKESIRNFNEFDLELTRKDIKLLRNLMDLLSSKINDSDQGVWDEIQLVLTLIPGWRHIIDI